MSSKATPNRSYPAPENQKRMITPLIIPSSAATTAPAAAGTLTTPVLETPPETPFTNIPTPYSPSNVFTAPPSMTPPRTPTIWVPPVSSPQSPRKESEFTIVHTPPAMTGDDFVLVPHPDPYAAQRKAALDTAPTAPESVIKSTKTLLGDGVWSRVYAAHQERPSSSTPFLIAIKTPLNKTAAKVLEKEAKILSFISSIRLFSAGIASGVVWYLGFDAKCSWIAMEMVGGGTLSGFVESRRRRVVDSEQNFSLATLRAPIVGMAQWLFFAERLVGVFDELKSFGVVHGDVKPSNILLRPYVPSSGTAGGLWGTLIEGLEECLWEPVVSDFSSGHLIISGVVPEAVSAVTTCYCAPELLESFLYRPPSQQPVSTPPTTPTESPAHPIPTFQTDLYSLALTLLFAAIGSEVYINAGRHVGIYARKGDPVGWVRGDERGLRVSRGGVVEDVLRGCFGTLVEKRCDVRDVGVRVKRWKTWLIDEESKVGNAEN